MRLVLINPEKGQPFYLNPEAVFCVTRHDQIIGHCTVAYSAGVAVVQMPAEELAHQLVDQGEQGNSEFPSELLSLLRAALLEEAALTRIYPDGHSRAGTAGRFLTRAVAHSIPGTEQDLNRGHLTAAFGALLHLARTAGHLPGKP